MLSIHYVSMMIRIFYVDWQKHWECDRTMNIGANAHGKRTVYGINKTATGDRLDHCWQLDFQRHWRGVELAFKSLDCFTIRLFHSATTLVLLHMYLLLETSPHWLLGVRVFIFLYLIFRGWGWGLGWSYLSRFGGEALNSDVFTIWCFILISRSSRVFWRFKRRSCISYQWFALLNLLRICVVHIYWR